MSITSEIRLRVKKEGDVVLNQLSAKLNDVASRSTITSAKFKDLSATLRQTDSQIRTKSINGLNDYARAWRELANNVDITSKEFKEATREAQRFEREAAKAQGRRGGGRFMQAAKGVGAVAAGGIFGGPEGFIGGGIGLALGGVGGAAVGAAIGAYVKNIREALGETASFTAAIRRQEIALQGVVGDGNKYAFALDSINKATRDFAIPTSVLTREFTKLQASVQGAGGNVEETNKTFRAIVGSIRATGGSIEDVRSALTATAQVFSKGKVSAEELRQQIGERLPGAFTLFAESIGKTPAELDKALEKGEVSLQDFMSFVELLLGRYEQNAKKIASGPEAAGDRLTVVLEDLKKTTGPILADIGASFQSFAAEAVTAIDGLIKKLGEFGREMEEKLGGKLLENAIKNVQRQDAIIQRFARRTKAGLQLTEQEQQQLALAQTLKAGSMQIIEAAKLGPSVPIPSKLPSTPEEEEEPDKPQKIKKVVQASNELVALYRQFYGESNEFKRIQIQYDIDMQKLQDRGLTGNNLEIGQMRAQERLKKSLIRLGDEAGKGLAKQLFAQKEIKKELTETQKLGQQIVTTFAQGMSDALLNLFDRAKSFRELLGDLLRQTAKLILNFGMQTAAKSIFPGLFATGGVMTNNGPVPLKKYAKGGIAYGPQMALFGEGSTPEAYVPLPDGRSIPVKMKGNNAGGANVTVNVDANSSNVQGNGDQAAQLGKAIGAAVQQELIKQKKPGGLLY